LKKIILNILKFTLFLGIGVFFIWIFVRQLTAEQIDEIFVSIRNANYWWLSFSIVVGFLSHVARGWRSMLLLQPMGYKPSFKNSFFAVMVGYLANLALPRLGEVLRSSYLVKYENIPFQKSFGTIITERAIDMIIFLALFVIGLIIEFNRLYGYVETNVINPMQEKLSGVVGNILLNILFGVAILGFVFIFIYRKKLGQMSIFKKMGNIIRGFFEGMLSVTKVKKPILFIFLSLMIWILYFFNVYVVYLAFAELRGLPITAALSCLNFGAVAFMVVQGGIGLYPAIIAEILSLYNAPIAVSYAAGWVGWSLQQIMVIVLGLIAIISASFSKSKYGLPETDKREDIS
jgi:uncharacterized protein (TIRG00374 family)